jgi:two-component system, chemotaxis family, CheB/CheR fusion protein
VVGIGSSAGGIEALKSFFKAMPADSGMALVLIQHLAPDYESLAAHLLGKYTAMPVKEAEEGMPLEVRTRSM